MRARRVFHAVDTHTEGMPTRVVTSGVGVFPGATMLERSRWLAENGDDIRGLLMFEPRGHSAMSGSILQPPLHPDADVGVVFIEVSGCLPMCGHGTIGTVVALLETGTLPAREPTTEVVLDTPAGLVGAVATVDDGHVESVRITNVASFLVEQDRDLTVPGLGTVRVDVAFGGNFYVILDVQRLGIPLAPESAPALIDLGLRVMAALDAAARPVHPTEPGISGCRHVILTQLPGPGGNRRSAVVIHPGYLDRSPCGTGTSALMAALHARAELGLGEPMVHESVLGSRFVGELVAETEVGGRPAVVPTISGRAWVTGLNQYVLDPTDPFPRGFLLGARPPADGDRRGG